MKRVRGFIRLYAAAKITCLIIASLIVATGGLPDMSHALITILTALASLTSVTIINDYFDIEKDKTRKLKRPLCMELITKDNAVALSAFLFTLSLALSHYFLNPFCTALILINTIIVIIYSYNKERSPLTELYQGYFNGSVILFGGLSISPGNIAITKLILILSTLIALTSSARKIAHNIDNQDGIKYRKNTLATYYGDRMAGMISSSLLIIAIFISIIPIASLGIKYQYIISVADIILAYSGLRLLINTRYAMESHRFVKISMILILIAFLVSALS
ncbi:MAG: UbiA family prenyltransferase [archaeon]